MQQSAYYVVFLMLPLAGADDDLGSRIVAQAREHLGKKVGNGQCAGLIPPVLESAGAIIDPVRQDDGTVIWGDPVPSAREAKPGDIITFKNAVFAGRRRVLRDGTPRIQFWRTTYPDHVAIIAEVREKGRVLVLLHQNVGDATAPESERQVVQETTLDLRRQRPGGTIRISRPKPRFEPKTDPH